MGRINKPGEPVAQYVLVFPDIVIHLHGHSIVTDNHRIKPNFFCLQLPACYPQYDGTSHPDQYQVAQKKGKECFIVIGIIYLLVVKHEYKEKHQAAKQGTDERRGKFRKPGPDIYRAMITACQKEQHQPTGRN